MQRVFRLLAALAVCTTLTSPVMAQGREGPTLAAVKKRGAVNCGVFGVIPGFSLPDSRGVMRGIDADECRAVAAAVLGNPDAVKWVLLTAQQRLPALQAGEVDVVYANLGWTMARETQAGVAYASIYYYNGQTFMVKKAAGVKTARELNGASICLTQGSTIEASVQEYFERMRISYKAVVFADVSEARKAFLADRCDATAGDSSSLAGFKAAQGAEADKYLILPERISNEPLGGAVRKGDWQWFDIVRWTQFALVQAEALGITSENIDSFKTSKNVDVRRFLGEEGNLGEALGLDKMWTQKVVKAVGNFGQVWDRNVVGVDRAENRIWTQGGLHYTPPFR